jgi:DNA-directed RNA polymerase specialized sigma24 family protein
MMEKPDEKDLFATASAALFPAHPTDFERARTDDPDLFAAAYRTLFQGPPGPRTEAASLSVFPTLFERVGVSSEQLAALLADLDDDSIAVPTGPMLPSFDTNPDVITPPFDPRTLFGQASLQLTEGLLQTDWRRQRGFVRGFARRHPDILAVLFDQPGLTPGVTLVALCALMSRKESGDAANAWLEQTLHLRRRSQRAWNQYRELFRDRLGLQNVEDLHHTLLVAVVDAGLRDHRAVRNLLGFLRQVTDNQLMTLLRHALRQPLQVAYIPLEQSVIDALTFLTTRLASPDPGPELLVVDREAEARWARFLATLSPRRRQVAALRYDKDLPVTTIARRLRIAHPTVSKMLRGIERAYMKFLESGR